MNLKKINLSLSVALLALTGLSACNKNVTTDTAQQEESQELEKYEEVTYEDLKEKITTKSVTVVDVNSLESYKSGHIPSAISFYEHEANLLAALPTNKDAEIICYCGGPSCGAWKKGADAVSELGYTNVKHYPGGLSGWTKAGGDLDVPKA